MYRCSNCEGWGIPPSTHLHIEEDIEGLLEIIDISRSSESKKAEEISLGNNTIVYRYLMFESDLFLISSSQTIASRPHCLCKECLEYSLSFVPHYGDGAYCTTNEHLKTEHPRIIHSQGIDIRAMDYRVVLKLKNAAKFKKIKKTAGVIRSMPLGEELTLNKVVLADKDSLKIIGFQKWDGNKWVDILLEDVKGVS